MISLEVSMFYIVHGCSADVSAQTEAIKPKLSTSSLCPLISVLRNMHVLPGGHNFVVMANNRKGNILISKGGSGHKAQQKL